jgi:hypothetical protein
VLETNFFGYVHGARAVLPHFRHQGHGVLINNASVYSHVGAPWLTAYVSSKFAVRGFSEALRQELAELPDVYVCTVSPSPIDTPIFASAANYSGRAVKAPPPTYPPEQVASAILASALHPKRERIVGGAGRLVTVAEAVAPRRFERVNRRYVNGLQFAAEPAPATDGNLYAPVSDGRAEVRGGWRRRPDPPPQLRRLAAVGLLAAGSLTIARVVTRSGRTRPGIVTTSGSTVERDLRERRLVQRFPAFADKDEVPRFKSSQAHHNTMTSRNAGQLSLGSGDSGC